MNTYLADKNFWIAALERAVKSFAQGLLVAGLGDMAGVLAIDWIAALSVAVGMFLASLLTSVASGVGGSGPSLTPAEILRTDVAAVEDETGYVAEEAAPFEEGTPVDVVEDYAGKHRE